MTYFGRHPALRNTLIACVIVICAGLLVARLYLNSWTLNYVNNILHNIQGYDGHAESISIDLYRGAYQIHKLVLNKKEGTIPTPFVAIENADLSIQWGALLHGRVVSEITLVKPKINFAVKNSAKQTGEGTDWTKPIKDLMPIDINKVTLRNGEVSYQDFASTPQVNIYIHDVEGDVINLRNVENPAQPLPSELNIHGSSIGDGKLRIDGRMNILKAVPDMDLQTQLENVDLTAINNYSRAYGAFDFKNGNCDFYSHLIVKDSKVSGYVKFLARNISINIEQNANPLQAAWATVVAGVIKIFTNPTHDQFATRADLQGDLKNINTNIWSALASILQNAFVEALHRGLDENGQEIPSEEKKPD